MISDITTENTATENTTPQTNNAENATLPSLPKLSLRAIAEDEATGNYYAVVSFSNRRGKQRRTNIPRAEFSDVKSVMSRLKQKGAPFTTDDELNKAIVRSL